MKRILRLTLTTIGVLIALCIGISVIGERNKEERDAAARTPSARQAVIEQAKVDKADQKRAADEKTAFTAMDAKGHLDAAKAALANGYDSKRKWGGDVEGALRHLDAITAPAVEEAEAKKLRQEIEARRAREKVITCDCELVQGRLVVTEGPDDDAAEKLGDVTVVGHSTLKSNAALWFALPEVMSITVIEYAKFNDVRGNAKTMKVAEFTVTRTTAKTIKWENVRTENVLKVIDKAWVAPGVAVLVDG